MCDWGTDTIIHVIRRNNPNVPDGWHPMAVDACIAAYVQTMNNQGVITVGCCCGHGRGQPIVLVDAESVLLLKHLGYEYRAFEDRTDVVEHRIERDHEQKTAD